jgi:hypothetical protein
MIRVKDHKSSLGFYQNTMGGYPSSHFVTLSSPTKNPSHYNLPFPRSHRNDPPLHPRNPSSWIQPLLLRLPITHHPLSFLMRHPLSRRPPGIDLDLRHRKRPRIFLPERKHRTPRIRPHLRHGRRSRRRVRGLRRKMCDGRRG